MSDNLFILLSKFNNVSSVLQHVSRMKDNKARQIVATGATATKESKDSLEKLTSVESKLLQMHGKLIDELFEESKDVRENTRENKTPASKTTIRSGTKQPVKKGVHSDKRG